MSSTELDLELAQGRDAARAEEGSEIVGLRISLRRKDIDKGVRVTVKGDGRGGFEEFSVEGGEDSDDVVGACGERKGRKRFWVSASGLMKRKRRSGGEGVSTWAQERAQHSQGVELREEVRKEGRTCCRTNDTRLLIDRFQELSNHQWHTLHKHEPDQSKLEEGKGRKRREGREEEEAHLDSLDLLLSSKQFTSQVVGLVDDVLLQNVRRC